MFHQVEGLVVDKEYQLSLIFKGVVDQFLKGFF